MGSILRILGSEFNVDDFELGWNLEPSVTHRKGDLIRKNKPESKRITTSQLIFEICEGNYLNLNGQIEDTIEFLKKNKVFLERISNYPTVEKIAIDFAFNSRIDRIKVEVQNDYLPAELIKLAGSFGMEIWLTQWPYENE